MLNPHLIQQFREDISQFSKGIHSFEAGETDRNAFKKISGGFGSYAQKQGGYMLRLRLPGGQISKKNLEFISKKAQEYNVSLVKLTTCQTIQFHNLKAEDVISLLTDTLDFGIITRGGGGDYPRNVMASPLSGLNPQETFDVTPFAQAAGEYLLTQLPNLHMPRKLKVAFSNTPEDEVHASFRDLGFVAQKDGTFSVFCAGGLGPNPKLGVHITDHAAPEEVSLYIKAMLLLFTTFGNYESRAKSRTRYLQDTLGAEEIRSHFMKFVEQARLEEEPLKTESCPTVQKAAQGELSPALSKNKRILPQKQEGLYSLSYHPLGGRLSCEKLADLYQAIKDIPEASLRLGPDGTLYIVNLTVKELPDLLEATADSASSLLETSVCCIGSSVCQHGLRDSYGLLSACAARLQEEQLPDGVLPSIHISGCPSSCASHQSSGIGFSGHSKRADGAMVSAFRLFVNGSSRQGETRLGTEKAVILESLIPDFLADLGRKIAADGSTFEAWYPAHEEEFDQLAKEYGDR